MNSKYTVRLHNRDDSKETTIFVDFSSFDEADFYFAKIIFDRQTIQFFTNEDGLLTSSPIRGSKILERASLRALV